MKDVLTFIGVIINVWVFIYSCAEISDNKINYKNKWFWIFLLIISPFIYIASGKINSLTRIMITYIMLIFSCKKIFNFNVTKSLIVSLLAFILTTISELIFVAFLTYFLDVENTAISQNYFATFATSIAVSTMQCFIISFKNVKYNFNKIIGIVNGRKTKTILVASIFLILVFIILLYYTYYKISGTTFVVTTLILVLTYSIITISLLV